MSSETEKSFNVKIEKRKAAREPAAPLFAVERVVALVMFFLLFIPGLSPARVSGLISRNLSLFTSAVSYSSLISGVGRGFRSNWVDEGVFITVYVASIIASLGIIAILNDFSIILA